MRKNVILVINIDLNRYSTDQVSDAINEALGALNAEAPEPDWEDYFDVEAVDWCWYSAGIRGE